MIIAEAFLACCFSTLTITMVVDKRITAIAICLGTNDSN